MRRAQRALGTAEWSGRKPRPSPFHRRRSSSPGASPPGPERRGRSRTRSSSRSTSPGTRAAAARSSSSGSPKGSPVSGPEPVPFVAVPDALAPMLDALQSLTAAERPAARARRRARGEPPARGRRRRAPRHAATSTSSPATTCRASSTCSATSTKLPARRPSWSGTSRSTSSRRCRSARDELDGLDDGTRLFVAGHRWAFDTATPMRLGTRGEKRTTVELPVATPAGLVAAKSHAVGYPRAVRRATKHGGDLFDVFRLIEVFDTDGSLGARNRRRAPRARRDDRRPSSPGRSSPTPAGRCIRCRSPA